MRYFCHQIEFLMPCFCAGADQQKAELRAPSIRGQLRWWFRALGGSADEEASVFGSVRPPARASAVQIRCMILKSGPIWQPPNFGPNDPESYVWHFASVSGKHAGTHGHGPRWASSAAISPGTTAKVSVRVRSGLPQQLDTKLEDAIRCFFTVGSLGLRNTRGLGSFHCPHFAPDGEAWDQTHQLLVRSDFKTEWLPQTEPNALSCARRIGTYLKGTRAAMHMKADKLSPFGSTTPSRQTSAIRFRPVQAAGGSGLRVLVLEAPQQRVLGGGARTSAPVVGRSPSVFVTASNTA